MIRRLAFVLALAATVWAQDVPVPLPTPEGQGEASRRGEAAQIRGGFEAVIAAQQEQMLYLMGVMLACCGGLVVTMLWMNRRTNDRMSEASATREAALFGSIQKLQQDAKDEAERQRLFDIDESAKQREHERALQSEMAALQRETLISNAQGVAALTQFKATLDHLEATVGRVEGAMRAMEQRLHEQSSTFERQLGNLTTVVQAMAATFPAANGAAFRRATEQIQMGDEGDGDDG